MDIKSQLPELADQELSNILSNARRLFACGSAAQRSAAAAIMPSIEAEFAAREAAKMARKNEALAARRAAKASARSAAE